MPEIDRRWVLGIMSGTSVDGVDLSAVRFVPDLRVGTSLNRYMKFPKKLRTRILALASADYVSKDELMKCSSDIGRFYADSAKKFAHEISRDVISISLIGCHGQTVLHRAPSARRSTSGVTLQIGSPDFLAQGLGVPVISDFRSADMAAGGRGAPLTPIAHFHLFNRIGVRQIIVNIGGISNATYLPGTESPSDIYATDCGPGNMLIDQACESLFGKRYDRNGLIASRGHTDKALLAMLRSLPFCRKRPPLALGREEFGSGAVSEILDFARRKHIDGESVLATLSFFTASCIERSMRSVAPADRVLVCGGGAWNLSLIRHLSDVFPTSGVSDTSREGIDPDFVESISFALLANLTVDRLPANLTQVTGAERRVVLGKITLP